MSVSEYRNLNDEALQVLERDLEIRGVYLDFLTYLQDIVNYRAGFGEPSMFSESRQAERVKKLSAQLPADAEIQAVALENREKALALQSGGSIEDSLRFVKSLLKEYDAVRHMRSRGRSIAAMA